MPSTTSRTDKTVHMTLRCIYKFRLDWDASGAYLGELLDHSRWTIMFGPRWSSTMGDYGQEGRDPAVTRSLIVDLINLVPTLIDECGRTVKPPAGDGDGKIVA